MLQIGGHFFSYFIGSLEICPIVFENREKFAIYDGGRRIRMEGRVSRIEA